MLSYILRRIAYIFLTLIGVSVVSFMLIQLPRGDYLSTHIMRLAMQEEQVSDAEIANLRRQYGLDQPVVLQYFIWMKNIILHGDFGVSFEWNIPVGKLILDRLGYTAAIGYLSVLFVWIVSVPIGIYCATHQYSAADYFFAVVGYLGLATPNFLLALVLMYLGFRFFGFSVGGLFSPEFLRAPWSLAKLLDMLQHVWIPVVVLGTAGTCGYIRRLRAILLDELRKQYVVTARAKGLREARLVLKYPVRVSITPLVSGLGALVTAILGGGGVVAVVLSLPTIGPLHLRAVLSQDMYLAGSILLFSCVLSLIGILVSDILLILVDPRIRFTGKS